MRDRRTKRPPVRRVAAVALLVAGAAGASVLGWRSALPERAGPDTGDVAAAGPAERSALDDLSRQLAEERAARARLEEAVAALEERVAALTVDALTVDALTAGAPAGRFQTSDVPGRGPSGPEGRAVEAGDPARAAARFEAVHGGPTRGDLDAESLVAAGFPAQEAAALEQRWESFELERLYLRDQATREGWLGTPRFRAEQSALDLRQEALRGELGDDAWDQVLYAAGRPNRVVVQSVLDGSPAGEAGLRAGDVILGYAGRRVFDGEELRSATTQGRAGESVAVEILRDDTTQRVFVPRGPLGVRLGFSVTQPSGSQD
jgi:hypothetical protein